MQLYDVLIVGAGPCGLAAGIEAAKASLSHLILEKGSITESIRRYPRRMRFFQRPRTLRLAAFRSPFRK